MIDMKLKRWLFGILVISVIVITALAANVDATSVNDFYFSNFNADYYLSRAENGTSRLHVKEILTAEFAEDNLNHGIIRAIPRTNQNGANQVVSGEDSLNLTVLRNGNPENIQKIEDNADSYSVYIGDPDEYLTGTQVYTLEYDFDDVITEFAADGSNVSGQEDASKAWQELYWDTNGTGWSQPFDKVTANLHLADEIKDRVSAETDCYVGKYGSSSEARCQTTKTADGFSFSAQNLGVGENLTFVAKFDPDTFVVILEKNYVPLIVLLVELVGGGALMAYFVRRWFKKAKPQEDAYKKAFVAPEYLPPKDLSVAEGSLLYLKKVKSSYVATLLEMAVQRKLTIKSLDEKNWSVILNAAPESLSKPEQEMLEILADGRPVAVGAEIAIEQHVATRALANHALQYQKDARELLADKGYFKAAKANFKLSTLGVVLGFIAIWVVAAVLMLSGDRIFDLLQPSNNTVIVGGQAMLIAVAVLFVAILAVAIWFNHRTARFSKYTESGIKMAVYLEGLERYIKQAEKERLAFLQSVEGVDTSPAGLINLYEKLLPWACLFGVEKSWAEELSRYYESATNTNLNPTLNPAVMHGIIAGNMANRINNTINHSTYYANSSSGSSGAGGGGFSGGGGGGGGGGGW